MNILTQAIADTARLHVKGADGLPLYSGPDKKPVIIVLHSPGSEAYAQIETKQTQRFLKRMDDNDGKRTAMTAEERVTQTAEDLADLTVDFENLEYEGKTGRGLFLAVYSDRRLGFIATQMNKFLADWGNFKGAPATP
ncbi:MAG: hypothetical protein DI640_01480 [Sphingomonas taxi]|uniref:Uncharacterized protein n=1 Tax=Sphingomonas taxi TaxID=1549858 RepID=A0A2W4Z410_9SPHN|nr:MAG: hypothetical protein DI640_01480 [Sphingomonas taxi]